MTLPPLETCSFSVQNFFCYLFFKQFQVLDSFVRVWIGLFYHSYNAKLAWRERGPDNQSVPSARPDGGVNGRKLSKNWTCLQMSPSLSPAKSSKAPLTPINTVLYKIILRLL